MKTTIEIADALLEDAKRVAAKEGITLRALVEDGLRKTLAERASQRSGFKLKDGSFRGGGGVQPGIDLSNWEQIRDIIYEGRGT